MSILKGKRVLFVGQDQSQLAELKRLLLQHQVVCLELDCAEVTPKRVADQHVDLVILNHSSETGVCDGLLTTLCTNDYSRTTPVFALVGDRESDISAALMEGAADYVTTKEEPLSALKKIKMIFGQPDTLSGPLIFEVPPDQALTTKTGVRVFIVEDDPLLRNLLDTRLDASSFPHEFSPDGEKVIDKLLTFQPQVIILDLMLPGKSGFEVLEEIKATKALAEIPVIVFSNRDSQEDRQRVARLGSERFFVKAMTDLSVLIEAIEELAR